jgi:hypothetical protein
MPEHASIRILEKLVLNFSIRERERFHPRKRSNKAENQSTREQ